MHKLTLRRSGSRILLLSSWLVFAGCHIPTGSSNAGLSGEESEISSRITEILEAVHQQDLPRLDRYHWYGPHFTKYASGGGPRQDAAAARNGEHAGIKAAPGLRLRAEDLKIDVFHGGAVATFIMTATVPAGADTVTKRERGTLVFVKQNGAWRIVHEHFSAAH